MHTLQSINARTGQAFGPVFVASAATEVDAAVQAASDAFEVWQGSSGAQRSALLEALAQGLQDARETLVALADEETGLGLPRLNGELDRTAFQLRRFGALAASGAAFAHTDDPAVAGPPPAGHPHMQRWHLPLGPVAMFAASNFPFAFSVLGGDTASALAAGCTVVVKAHPGHPQTSQQVWQLVQRTLQAQGWPAGLVGMVQGAGHEVGVALVMHPGIAAGAFTGSTRGGAALQAAAQQRLRPMPFYGELGAINPVVATSEALQAGGSALAQALAGSITMGCGQFCTNPGLLVLERSAAAQAFVADVVQALAAAQPHAMLTPGMRSAWQSGVQAQLAAGAQALLHEPTDAVQPRPFLAQVDAPVFVRTAALHDEVFGPSSLVVWCDSAAEVAQVLRAVGGSLTVTLWGAQGDGPAARALVRVAMHTAGRVLFAGMPTGVAVTAAQQHGGPWPASTAPMTTSVGDAALLRFLRPVALQDAPAWLLAQLGQPV